MKAFLVALAVAVTLASADAARTQDSADTAASNGRFAQRSPESGSAGTGNGAGDVQPVEPLNEGPGAAGDGPSLFAGSSGEDPGVLEIKRIARDLVSRRAMMLQLAELQRDLIEFAMADPVAAWRSRIPSSVCEYALRRRFCDAMTSSFRKDRGSRP